MNSVPDFLMDMINNAEQTYRTPEHIMGDDGADVDAFNDAFEEVYTEFLARRETRGDYRLLGAEQRIERLKKNMRRIAKLISTGQGIRSAVIELVLCGLEILSIPKGK